MERKRKRERERERGERDSARNFFLSFFFPFIPWGSTLPSEKNICHLCRTRKVRFSQDFLDFRNIFATFRKIFAVVVDADVDVDVDAGFVDSIRFGVWIKFVGNPHSAHMSTSTSR